MNILLRMSLIVLFGYGLAAMAKTADQPDLTGSWSGAMQVGNNTLRLRFNFSKMPDGHYSATMDSIDQGASGIPVSKVVLNNLDITLEIAAAQSVYRGQYQHGSGEIHGHWQQAGQAFALVLAKQQTPDRKSQDPQPPYPYIEEHVVFDNAVAGIQLAGTLTRPADNTMQFPAVVLISGSGPQDRDQQILGHRPFLVLADYLTRQGFAVLRFDERGVGQSGGIFQHATSLDFATDVAAAVRYLQSRSFIKQRQIGLIGHSEGGLIAPIVAQKQAGVSFMVLLAAPGLPGSEISAAQFSRILKYNGLSEQAISHGTNLYRTLNELAAQPDTSLEVAELKKHYQLLWQNLPLQVQAELAALGGGSLSAERQAELSNPWFRYFQQHDPQVWLARTTIPTLAVHGSKDFQLDADSNLAAIDSALKQAQNPHYQLLKMAGVNHLFQEAQTDSWDEYAKLEQTLSPKLLELLANWLKQVTDIAPGTVG